MHDKTYSANLLDFMSSSEPISEVQKKLEKVDTIDCSITMTEKKSEQKSEKKAKSHISKPVKSQSTNKVEKQVAIQVEKKVRKQKPAPLLKIGNVAKLLDLNTSVLRFWEDEFEELKPIRTQTGQRLYSAQDIAIAKKLKKLLHENGLTLEGARKILKKSTLPKGSPYSVPKTGKVKALSLNASTNAQESHKEQAKQNIQDTSSSEVYALKAEQEKRKSFLKAIELELLDIKKNLFNNL